MSANEITLTTIYEILKEHTARFDRMDQRFDAADKRADRFETVQNSIALRLITVESTVKEHSAMLRTMQFRLDSLHGLVETTSGRSVE